MFLKDLRTTIRFDKKNALYHLLFIWFERIVRDCFNLITEPIDFFHTIEDHQISIVHTHLDAYIQY